MLPVFVINLDRSPQRMAKIAATLDRLGVPFERIAAVDGADPDQLRGLPVVTRFGRTPLRTGEIGCFASHHGIWRRMVEAGPPVAVVLEDDAAPSDDFPGILAALERADVDFVRLAKIQPKDGLFYGTLAGRRVVEAASFAKIGGTGAYVLSRDAARRFAEAAAATGWSMPVDDYIDQAWLHGVRTFEFAPPVVALGAFASDIYVTSPKPERRDLRRRPKERLARELRRFVDWTGWAAFTLTRVLPDHAARRLAALVGRPMIFGRARHETSGG